MWKEGRGQLALVETSFLVVNIIYSYVFLYTFLSFVLVFFSVHFYIF